ncbi:MAG: radical SAM protein [Anaerolineae bacterium]
MDWRQIASVREVLGSEQGAIVRDWGGKVPIVLAYPNTYAVGMSSLAMHGLYRLFNALPGVVCERAFSSLERHPRAGEVPLTLESQRPIGEAALVAFSLSFEMDYLNLIDMLRRAGIPGRASEREEGDPYVVLGGPAVSANPEPLAAVADAIVVGEAEELLGDLVDCIRASHDQDRTATLDCLARLEGVYVPLRHSGGAVRRRWVRDLDAYPTSSAIVAPRAEFGDMHLIEIARGCGHGCRFCLAGYWYRPPRERSLSLIVAQAREGLRRLRKVGLVASAVSDYTHIDELVSELRALGADISVSSLRVAPLTEGLVRALAESGSRTITFAPEAGSEALRRTINKCITHDQILAAAAMAASYGFETLKLYFMVGLPGESDDDIEALIDLSREVAEAFARNVTVNVTPLVPKAHTPFERAPLVPEDVLAARLVRLRTAWGKGRVSVRAEGADSARVQAVLARGDRTVGEALLRMRRPSPARFEQSLRELGAAFEDYTRAREPGEALPWDVIDSRVRPAYRQAEAGRAATGTPTPDCAPEGCARCGSCPEQECP